MKKYSEAFLAEYQEQLPQNESIELTYISCLKETKRAAVYLAKPAGDEAYVVVKIAAESNDLAAEFAALQQLSALPQAQTPVPFALYNSDGKQCMLRQYIQGLTLAQWRDEQENVTDKDIVRIGTALCRLIAAMHKQGFIARDIKPSNFVITPLEQIYMIDVGALRVFDADKSDDTQYIGTMGYAAPEQFGFSQTSTRTDVYGLGKLLAYLAAGSTDKDALKKAHIGRRIKRIIRKCTAFDPKRRYACMRDVENALKGKASKFLIGLAALIALALAATGLFFSQKPMMDEPIALVATTPSQPPQNKGPTTNTEGTLRLNMWEYESLKALIDSIPYTDDVAEIYFNGDVILEEELKINRPKVVFCGEGTIMSAPTRTDDGYMIHIPFGAQLTVKQGITLKTTNGPACVYNDGEFILDGGTLYHEADIRDFVFFVTKKGTMHILSGEIICNGVGKKRGYITQIQGTFIMDGGTITITAMENGLLNAGKAYYNGGTIRLIDPLWGNENCVWDFNGGISEKNGTQFYIDDQERIY